ncbi:MAG: glycosyltransferase family 2 protein [Turneriella sp.]
MTEVSKRKSPSAGQQCRVAAVAMVKNEEDIIELFIRHTLSVCDRLYICNHNSADRTVEIIHALAGEGFDIRLTHSTAAGYPQEQITHGLITQAIAEGAEWILPLDADEFPVSETGSVRDAILSLDPAVEWRYVWRNYFFSSEAKLKDKNFFKRFDIYGDSMFGKCLFHSKLYSSHYCRITKGNHFLKYAGRRSIPQVNLVPGVKLAHFPAPTFGKLVWKNINFGIIASNRGFDEIAQSGWMHLDVKNISELYASGNKFSKGSPRIAPITTKYTTRRFASDERYVIAQLAGSYREYHERATRAGFKRFRGFDKYRELLRYGFVATLSTIWNVLTRAGRKHKSAHGQQLTSGMGGFYINFTDI